MTKGYGISELNPKKELYLMSRKNMFELTARDYAKLNEQQYTLATNTDIDEAEERANKYRELGLDVIVEESAFGMDGRALPYLKAILIRNQDGTRVESIPFVEL